MSEENLGCSDHFSGPLDSKEELGREPTHLNKGGPLDSQEEPGREPTTLVIEGPSDSQEEPGKEPTTLVIEGPSDTQEEPSREPTALVIEGPSDSQEEPGRKPAALIVEGPSDSQEEPGREPTALIVEGPSDSQEEPGKEPSALVIEGPSDSQEEPGKEPAALVIEGPSDSQEEPRREPIALVIEESPVTLEEQGGECPTIVLTESTEIEEELGREPTALDWLAFILIVGMELAEKIAYFGISANLVTYIFQVVHLPFLLSSLIASISIALLQGTTIIGSFFADECLGNYFWMIFISGIIYSVGLIGMVLSNTIGALPSRCDKSDLQFDDCERAKGWQILYMIIFIFLSTLGSGGLKACVSTFRQAQFDKGKWWMEGIGDIFSTIGSLATLAIVATSNLKTVFIVAATFMTTSTLLFFVGRPLYRHELQGSNPFMNVCKVVVAAINKRNSPFTRNDMHGDSEGQTSLTNRLRCLNKAVEGGASVAQVEEAKVLIKLLPITSCTILLAVLQTILSTLTLRQISTMNTKIGSVSLPPSSIPLFSSIFNIIIFFIYRIACHLTVDRGGVSTLRRVGIGLIGSILATVSAIIIEIYRRRFATSHHYTYHSLVPMTGFSVGWMFITYALSSIGEVFVFWVGLTTFIKGEIPDAIQDKNIHGSFLAAVKCTGSFVAAIMTSLVMFLSKDEFENNWMNGNVNRGRFEWVYGILTILSVPIFCMFVCLAKKYNYRE